jgi:hypothetical protein
MLSLFWGIGPAIVMYLLLRDWWSQGGWPLRRDGNEDDD